MVGGERNWDYRFTWIRDASFTAATLVRLGFTEEASAFISWVKDRYRDAEEPGKLQIMYGIDGRRELTEEILEHLEGYRTSAPVRIGNAAAVRASCGAGAAEAQGEDGVALTLRCTPSGLQRP